MLQRIQTVFLVLAAAAMLVASATPLATFHYNYSDEVVFEAMGVYLNGILNDSTWGLFALSLSSSVLALITISNAISPFVNQWIACISRLSEM